MDIFKQETRKMLTILLAPILVGLQWHKTRHSRVETACGYMYHLNHRARVLANYNPERDLIYRLKLCLITWLSLNGYLLSAFPQIQTMKCNRCNGTGMFQSNRLFGITRCYHCNNGVYKSHHLTLFHFLVNGVEYQWHKPTSLIPYVVIPESSNCCSLPVYAPEPRTSEPIPDDIQSYLMMLYLYWFFRDAVKTPAIFGLIRRSRFAINNWSSNLGHHLYFRNSWYYRFVIRRNRLTFRLNSLKWAIRSWYTGNHEEDEIPF